MSKPAAPRIGWGISLRYRGTTLKDLRLRGDRPLRAGEGPECELVVPGLGEAAVLAQGEVLRRVAGLGGVVHRADEQQPYAAAEQLALAPGDHATLTLDAHPEITLELRRQEFERLPLATLFHVRDLARQLVLGAGLLAGLALLIHQERPVNVLELKGDPDAPDSALVRAMFVAAAEAPRVDLHHLDAQRIVSLPAPAPPAAAAPEPVVVPVPLLLAAETPVPVLAAEVDAQPTRARKRARGRAPKTTAYAILGTPEEMNAIFGVAGGVVGGQLNVLSADVFDDEREPALVLDAVPGAQVVPPVESAVPVAQVVSTVEPAVPPSGGGANSHEQAGVELTRGVVGGLAAVAPARCDDPSLTPRSQLDVVFVVDVSTTMAFMLDRIEQQIASVDVEARAQGLDARYGLVVFVDDVQLGNAGQPYTDLAALQRDLARWRVFTASNRQVGSEAPNLDWPENTLDAVHAAATGFAWRPADTTLRMIVHATDDDFGEAPAIQSGHTIQHSYRQTVAALRDTQVRMFSFAAKIGGECECLDVRPGLFTRFRGQPSLPDATGGAAFDIDEVASGKLSFVAAVAGAIKSGVCTHYPVKPGAR